MRDITVRALTADQFKEVAKHYSWDKFSLHDSSSLYQIYFKDGKPSEWDFNAVDKYFPNNKKVTFIEWLQLINPKKEVNMKYVVEVTSHAQAELVIKTLKLDLSYYGTPRVDNPIAITSNGKHGDAESHKKRADLIQEYGPIISFETFTQMFGVVFKPSKTLKLTSDYSAVINYDTKIVQVGCQSIPFTKVEELAKLIKE